MDNEEKNSYVKERLTEGLLELLEQQELEDISVRELAERAGVHRVSFYRNFKSKREILAQQAERLLREWGREFEARGDRNAFGETLLCHYHKHRAFYFLLYRRGLSDIIYESIRGACRVTEAEARAERYGRGMFAGMVFGWVDEWMRLGMTETAEELTELWRERS